MQSNSAQLISQLPHSEDSTLCQNPKDRKSGFQSCYNLKSLKLLSTDHLSLSAVARQSRVQENRMKTCSFGHVNNCLSGRDLNLQPFAMNFRME